MIIVIVGGCHDNPSCIERFSGSMMVISVVSVVSIIVTTAIWAVHSLTRLYLQVLIAVDIGMHAQPPTKTTPDADMQGKMMQPCVIHT